MTKFTWCSLFCARWCIFAQPFPKHGVRQILQQDIKLMLQVIDWHLCSNSLKKVQSIHEVSIGEETWSITPIESCRITPKNESLCLTKPELHGIEVTQDQYSSVTDAQIRCDVILGFKAKFCRFYIQDIYSEINISSIACDNCCILLHNSILSSLSANISFVSLGQLERLLWKLNHHMMTINLWTYHIYLQQDQNFHFYILSCLGYNKITFSITSIPSHAWCFMLHNAYIALNAMPHMPVIFEKKMEFSPS